MTQHDTGVTELLRRASDDLAPDVDRLVRGGITRGRSRQRRARIGTTVASLAVIGVVGALAAVVPQGGPDSARGRDLATEPTATEAPTETPTGTPTETPTESATEPPPTSLPVELAVSAVEVPATVERLLGLEGRISQPSVQVDEPDEVFVQLLVDGMVLSVGLELATDVTRARCESEAARLDGTCEAVDNGGWLLTWGPTLGDGVTCTGVSLVRYGFDTFATSCNAAVGKESTPLAPAPPLDATQLRTLVSTNQWFE
jgi:hypothetical protein